MKAIHDVKTVDNPVTVTFDTLSAVKELRKSGVDEHQAETIVATISKAMGETVATKVDLELQTTVLKADLELQTTAVKTDVQLQTAALKADLESQTSELRADLESQIKELRTGLGSQITDLRTELKSLAQTVDRMQDKIIIRLGALMVTMTFLLMAVGPFYIRWVMSMMGAQ